MDDPKLDGSSSKDELTMEEKQLLHEYITKAKWAHDSRGAKRALESLSDEQLPDVARLIANRLRMLEQNSNKRGECDTIIRSMENCTCRGPCWIVEGDAILKPVETHDEDKCVFHRMKFSTVQAQINNCMVTEMLKEPLENYKAKYLTPMIEKLNSETPIFVDECTCHRPCWIVGSDAILKPSAKHFVDECLYHRMNFATVEAQINNCAGAALLKKPMEKYTEMYSLFVDEVTERLRKQKCTCPRPCWIIGCDGILTPVEKHFDGQCIFHRMKFSTVWAQINNCAAVSSFKEPLQKYKEVYLAPVRPFPMMNSESPISVGEMSEGLRKPKCICLKPCWIVGQDVVLRPVFKHYEDECVFHKLRFSTVEAQINNCVGADLLQEPLENYKKINPTVRQISELNLGPAISVEEYTPGRPCWVVGSDGILMEVDNHFKGQCFFHRMKFSDVEGQIINCVGTVSLKEPLKKYKEKYLANGLKKFRSRSNSEPPISLEEKGDRLRKVCTSRRPCWVIGSDAILRPVDTHYEDECVFHRMEFSAVEAQINNCVDTEFLIEPLENYKKMQPTPLREFSKVISESSNPMKEVSKRLRKLQID